MKHWNLSILSALRFVVVIFACSLVLVSNVLPAYAMGSSSKSKPSDGPAQLNKIEERAQDVAKSDPLSLEETQARSQGGLNEVQGAADKNKMSRPSNSQDATTIQDQVEGALEKVAGKG
jgi:hypothetical protein